jgi:hypothetical protein
MQSKMVSAAGVVGIEARDSFTFASAIGLLVGAGVLAAGGELTRDPGGELAKVFASVFAVLALADASAEAGTEEKAFSAGFIR